MEVLVEHLGAVQFEVKARKHTLISDQPAENKGLTFSRSLAASSRRCGSVMRAGSRISLICSSLR